MTVLPDVSFWTVLAAAASTLVVGSLWYAPRLMGNRWMSLAGVSRDHAASRSVWPMIITALVSLITAWVFAGATAVVHTVYGGTYLLEALSTGTLLWAGFTAARMITHDAFEGRPVGLTTVNIAHELATVLAMALVIGLTGT
jgi:hypothetical protein